MEAEKYFTERRLSQFAISYKKFPVLWCCWHPKYAYLKYFTERRLSQFAISYKKFPVLWCCWHPKYAYLPDRSRALRRLASTQGVPSGPGVTRRMVRLCQHFHQRVKQEMSRLAAAEGSAAAVEAPPWALAAEKYLCLMPFAREPAPARRLVRLARGVGRGARAGAGLGTRAAAALAPRLGLPAAHVVKLWRELRHEALGAVHAHILRGDALRRRAPAALHWAVADLCVLYGGEVTADEHYQKVETLEAMLATFHLVQQYELEPGTGLTGTAWTRVARMYSRKWGAAASALLLQRRWFELRESTRRRLTAGPAGPHALPLHRAIADRYPAVVSGPPVSWEQLRCEGRLARPTSASGPAPGETFCMGFEEDDESEDSDNEEANDDDVILIEREIETINVDGDDSGDDGPAPALSLPDLDDVQLPDTDARGQDQPGHAADTRHDHDQPTTVSKYFNKAKTPVEELGVKQVDKSVVSGSELQDNGDVNQDTDATADVEKGTDETVNVNKQTDTIGDCALSITSIINQTAACSKTITDCDSKNIDASVNASNEVRDNVEVSIGTKKKSTVSKYSDKIIDNSKEIVDCDKADDHNLVEALKELDADFVETVIMFESDEDDVKVKADPNDEQISDKGVTEKFNECLETSSSVGQVEKESKILHKVSGLSGPKSKTTKLRNRIQFESDEEGVNTKADDASDDGRVDGVHEASDSRVNNEDEDIKSAMTTENTKNTERSEIDSHKDQNLSECRRSFISRKRRLSESSESDEGLLVIADDVRDSSKDRTEVDDENEEVDVVTVSDDAPANTGSPSVVRYPLLLELLSSKSDDLKRYKRFEEIKRRVKNEAKKLLKQRCEETELDAIATRVVRESLAQSSARIEEYARDIVTELNDGSAGDADDEPDQFDEKLLMIPVVCLTRMALPTRSALSARARRLLARCRPCGVRLARCDRPARVAKRVRLPDIAAVRALNRTIATAQVAPISAPQAAEGAGAGAGAGASAGPSGAPACRHHERDKYNSSCGACEAAALARPAGSRAAAELQRRALRRTARLARYQQVLAERQQRKKPKKDVKHAPAPAHPPRAKSPYDPQRALNDWLREKSVVAEKFGIKPRSFRKVTASAAAAAPAAPSIVTMNKAGELNPPLLLNNCSQPSQAVAAHYVVDNEGAVLSAVARPQPDSPAAAGPGGDAAPRQYRTAFTLNPVSQGYSPKKSTTQIVVTQTWTPSVGQTAAKMTPKFFNLNCVANINKTLNTLATHEPPPLAPEAGEGFLPIITHVESLAGSNSPPGTLTLNEQTTITPIQGSNSQNIAQQVTNENTQCNASFANSSQGNVILSGGGLTSQSGYVIQGPQSVTQAQRSTVIQTLNRCETSSVIQYNTVPTAPLRPDASRVMLVTSPAAPVTQTRPIFQRQANVLQVNSVQAGPPQTSSLVLTPQGSGQGQLTMTLVNPPLVKTNSLHVTAVHAGLPKTNSMAVGPQNPMTMTMLPSEERRVVQLNATLQASGAQLSSVQATPSQTNAIVISALNAQNNLNNLNKMVVNQPGSSHSPPSPPGAVAPPSSRADPRSLVYEKIEPSLPEMASRTWAAGQDPTALSVLAAGPGAAWRMAGHLVLCEAGALRAADHYYSLAPLRRLILPDEEDKIKLDVKKRKENKAKESAKPDKEKEPSVPWLKVKSFAKMGNDITQGAGGGAGGGVGGGDGGDGEDTDSAEEVEVMLRAPPRVYLENKVYAKMSDTPLIYAKVLHDVSGPAACRARLLRREPVLLYSPRTHALAPVYGEPSADGTTITLTAAKEVFGVMQQLAACLAPPGAPAPLHKRPAPAATVVTLATAPTPATAPTKPPDTRYEVMTKARYGKFLEYMAYAPDKMTGGTKSLIKKTSKSRGEGRARAGRPREAGAPGPVIDLASSGED